MLKLVKSYSDEAYPLSPQTSSVRKLTIKGHGNVVDMTKSYLLIRNSLKTTINGGDRVYNVGWGSSFAQDNQWMYPSVVQLKTCRLKVGALDERVEDVNLRVCNFVPYTMDAEKMRTGAIFGGLGFQRLENGPKSASPADADVNITSQGLYRSVFIDETMQKITPAAPGIETTRKAARTYKEVQAVIFLSDIFQSCGVSGAEALNVGGAPNQEVMVELEFEDVNRVLTECVNFPTDQTTDPEVPRPSEHSTLALTPNTLRNDTAAVGTPPTIPASPAELLTKLYQIDTVNVYNHAGQVPVSVGDVACLWKDADLPAVPGANIVIITQISVPSAGGVATLQFKCFSAKGQPIETADGVFLTPAEFFATLYAAPNYFPKALSLITEPRITAGVKTTFEYNDAGKATEYKVESLELVMCEKVGASPQKQSLLFNHYLRDTIALPAGQINFQHQFMIEPGCRAIHAVLPPKETQAGPQDNLMGLSYVDGISEGVSYRNLLNNKQIYQRDITMSSVGYAVEPGYVNQLINSAISSQVKLNSFDTLLAHMKTNGITQHMMISEPVELSANMQQFNLRVKFDVNPSDRTVYLFKAVAQEVMI